MAEVHGKAVVLYIGEYDVSAAMQTAATASNRDLADVSAYGDANHTYVAGLGDGSLTLDGNFDGGALPSIDAILAAKKGLAVQALAMPRGDLTAGNRAFMLGGAGAVLTQYDKVSSISDAVKFNSMIHGGGPFPGRILDPKTAFAATGNGTDVDNGALTSQGAIAQLHVLVNNRSTNTTFTIEHSVDGTTWVTLFTFTVVPTNIITSEQLPASAGTVNRHLRLVRTLTAGTGTITATAAVHRKVA